jgi:hypothetical protein
MHRCLKQLTEQRRQRGIRVEEEHEIEAETEEKRKAERRAEIQKTVEKAQRDRLRNEPKSSAATDKPVSTSGKSANKRPRDFATPEEYVQWVIGAKPAAPEGAQPAKPAAPDAGEAQKPS